VEPGELPAGLTKPELLKALEGGKALGRLRSEARREAAKIGGGGGGNRDATVESAEVNSGKAYRSAHRA